MLFIFIFCQLCSYFFFGLISAHLSRLNLGVICSAKFCLPDSNPPCVLIAFLYQALIVCWNCMLTCLSHFTLKWHYVILCLSLFIFHILIKALHIENNKGLLKLIKSTFLLFKPFSKASLDSPLMTES